MPAKRYIKTQVYSIPYFIKEEYKQANKNYKRLIS